MPRAHDFIAYKNSKTFSKKYKKPSCREICLERSLYFQPFSGYWALIVFGSGSRDVVRYVTTWFPICHFLLVLLWNKASVYL